MGGLFENLSGAAGIKAEGKSAQNIANFNAQVAEQEAVAAQNKAAFAARRQAKKGVEIKSALEAKLGAAGGIGSPVAADLVAEQAAELELENLLIGFQGEIESERFKNQATIDRLQGKAARRASRSKATAANVGFGLQLASLGVSGFNSFKKPTTVAV